MDLRGQAKVVDVRRRARPRGRGVDRLPHEQLAVERVDDAWEVGRDVLGAFFIGMRYTTAYGAIGSFIALLLWCYYGISILFFGAEYVQILESRRRERLSGEQARAIQGAAALTQESTQACVIEAPTDQMREPLHMRVRPRRIA